MPTNPEQDLERIEALAKAATAGPWNSSREDMDSYLGNGTFVCYVYRGERERIGVIAENAREDARFIAAANPETVLALVARVRELEAASKSLTEERRKEICGMQDLLEKAIGRARELERGLEIIRDFGSNVEFINATLDGAKGEAHGPQCHICHGKGWLNTADQNELEDGAKGGN